jgi:hypothetical protein
VIANRICYTRDGDAEVRPAALEQRDQRRGGGDRRQLLLPVVRDVMFGNSSSTCRNDPKRESPRRSSSTASGGWSPTVSSPGARHPWSPRRIQQLPFLQVQHHPTSGVAGLVGLLGVKFGQSL